MKSIVLSGALAAMVAVSAPVTAEPSFGFGVSYVFGGGVALGARVFSTDKPKNAAVSLGMDYRFDSGTWRPNVGAAYLDNDFYLDLSRGLTDGYVDYGAGIGVLGGMQ